MLDSTLWFTLGTLAMLAGTTALTYGCLLLPAERRRRFVPVAAVPAVAAAAYGLLVLGVGGVGGADGATVHLPRYGTWLVATAVHVGVIGLLVGASSGLVGRLVGLQALSVLAALAGALLGAPVRWPAYLFGLACFAGVAYALFVTLEPLTVELPDDREALVRKLRSFVVVLWLVYPAVWTLGPHGLGTMDPETTALVVTYLDVVALVGFGLVAVTHAVHAAAVDRDDETGRAGSEGPGDGDDDGSEADPAGGTDVPAPGDDAPVAGDDGPSVGDETPAAD